MRSAPLVPFALLLLMLAPSFARSEPQNGGAAISLHNVGIRVPFGISPQADSGAFVILADTRNGTTDAYAQRVDRHGVPQLGPSGVRVWTGFGSTQLYNIISDGSGGALLLWTQYNATTGTDIYVQRVLSTGALAYGSSGLLVCNAPFEQHSPQLVIGSSGFFYVAWTDNRANVAGQADVYIQRYSLAGTPSFAVNGLLVNTIAFRTYSTSGVNAAPDLTGGLLLSWSVYSPGGLRAQRVSSAGALQFGATGAALADPNDSYATIAPDGSGGLWAYTLRYSSPNYSPYAHHLTSAGTSAFAPAGIAFHSPLNGYFRLSLVRNASGGCFFIGTYYYSSDPNYTDYLFRQEVSATGTLLRGPDGEQLSYHNIYYQLVDAGSQVLLASANDEYGQGTHTLRLQRLAFDGTPGYPGMGQVLGRSDPNANGTAVAMAATAAGLVFEAHADGRYASPARPLSYQAFGQAFDAAGNPLWDDAENPVIAAAEDAPSDQGGRVRVTWTPGAGDTPWAGGVVRGYRGWRALGTAVASKLAARAMPADTPFEVEGRSYVIHAGLYWEAVGESPAAQASSYALTLPTGQDSTAGGPANESFMVEAWDDSSHHWWSGVKAAHSVDNLGPATPAPFTGQYGAGTAHLHWNPNLEADLAGYRLYRGSSPGFVPGPSNLVGAPPDTGWSDAYGSPAVYKLSAVDIHGNESPFATLTPSGSLGVGGELPGTLAFSLVGSNPTRAGTSLRLALPTASHVRLAIYDAAGRQVRSLINGEQPAGEWFVDWNGADAGGRSTPSGLYFARMDCSGRSFTVRIVAIR